MIRPLKNILLVEKLKEVEPTKSGIVLTRDNTSLFDKVKILEVGPKIKDIKKGDICYVHKIVESLEVRGSVGFITEDHVFAVEEQGTPGTVAN